MAIIFNVDHVDPASVHVGVSPMSELLAVLHVLAEPDHHMNMNREIAVLNAKIPESLRRQMAEFAPLWARFRFRAMLPLEADSLVRGSFDEEVSSVAKLPLEIFSAMAIQGIVGRSEPDYSAALVDSRVAAEALADLRDRSVTRQSMLLRLLRDPAQFRDETLELIAACETTFFGSRWKDYEARLGPAAKELTPRLQNEGLAQMLVLLASGTPLFNETQQVAIDKLQNAFVIGQGRSFHLVPSLLTQPHVIVKHDSRYAIQDESLASAECQSYGLNLPIVVQFPLAEIGADRATAGQIQKRMAALTDASRLDICRHLVNEPCTTAEIARRVGMSAPQVSRHLRRLRENGLLESSREGKHVNHRLNLPVVYSLGYDLVSRITH